MKQTLHANRDYIVAVIAFLFANGAPIVIAVISHALKP